jgi:hypothetical protein
MGCSAAYTRDCRSLFGGILNHDDDLGNGTLVNGFVATKEFYESRFPEAGPYNPPATQVRHRKGESGREWCHQGQGGKGEAQQREGIIGLVVSKQSIC